MSIISKEDRVFIDLIKGMVKKYFFIIPIVCGCILSANDSMGLEHNLSIKIIYEIDSQVEAKINLIDENDAKPLARKETTDSPKLKYEKTFKDLDNKSFLLKEDNGDIFTESSKSQEFRQALDTKKVTTELHGELTSLLKRKGFSVKDENVDYIVFFKVEKISYDDFKGIPYAQLVYYKLTKGDDVIYQNTFVPQEKKYLFGGGKYTQLINTKALAVRIADDLYAKIK